MLLAVAIVATAIFSLIDVGCTESSSGFQSQAINIGDFGVSASQNLDLLIENQQSDSLHISEVKITGNNGERNISLDQSESEIPPGDSNKFSLPAFETTFECNEKEIEIVYDIGELEDVSSTGTITSDIALQDIGEPEPLADLELDR